MPADFAQFITAVNRSLAGQNSLLQQFEAYAQNSVFT